MRTRLNAVLFSIMLAGMSASAFAAQQTAAPAPDKTTIKQDRAKIKADREKLRADREAGNAAAVREDKALLKADIQKLRVDAGGRR
jgi:hypothetical protein